MYPPQPLSQSAQSGFQVQFDKHWRNDCDGQGLREFGGDGKQAKTRLATNSYNNRDSELTVLVGMIRAVVHPVTNPGIFKALSTATFELFTL